MEAIIQFVWKVILAATALSILLTVYRRIVTDGITGIRPSDVSSAPLRVLNNVGSVILKALSLPFVIIKNILRAVMQIPINLAWDKVPGVKDVADAPQVVDLIPLLD